MAKPPIPKDRPKRKLKGKVPRKKTSTYSNAKEKLGLKSKGKKVKGVGLGVLPNDVKDVGKWIEGYEKTGNGGRIRKVQRNMKAK